MFRPKQTTPLPKNRTLAVLTGVGLVLATLGCATPLKPIYPSGPVEAATKTWDVRFSPERVVVQEAGVPMSTGMIWKRDVATFTADRLNTMVGSSARGALMDTSVVLTLATAGGITFGSSKELSVSVTSVLPDGRVVETQAVAGYIDNSLEFFASQALLFGGPIFEVGAFTLGLFIFTMGLNSPYATPFCGCILALALGGLMLNVAQATAQWIIGLLEERRASDLLQNALIAHAKDVQTVLAGGPLPPRSTPRFPLESPWVPEANEPVPAEEIREAPGQPDPGPVRPAPRTDPMHPPPPPVLDPADDLPAADPRPTDEPGSSDDDTPDGDESSGAEEAGPDGPTLGFLSADAHRY